MNKQVVKANLNTYRRIGNICMLATGWENYSSISPNYNLWNVQQWPYWKVSHCWSNNVIDAMVASNHFLVGLKDFSLEDMPDTDKIAKNLRQDR